MVDSLADILNCPLLDQSSYIVRSCVFTCKYIITERETDRQSDRQTETESGTIPILTTALHKVAF